MIKNKKIWIILILIFITFVSLSDNTSGIQDPSVVYCEEMGYKIKINRTELGEYGVCVVEENVTEFIAWDFYEGKVGKEYSYCAKNGYDIETISDGKDPYSPDYAVCILKEGNSSNASIKSSNIKTLNEMKIKRKMKDLMNLDEKIRNQQSELNVKSNDISENKNSLRTRDIELLSSSSLPSSFDWRDYNGANWLTLVKQQLCGNCWAYSANGGIEAKIKIARNDPHFDVDLSEQYLVSCSGAGSCRYGGSEEWALNYIKNNGVTDDTCFKDSGTDEPCSNKCTTWNKRLWKIDDVTSFNGYVSDDDIKTYLIEKGPLPAGMFYSGYWDGDIYRCDENSSEYPAPKTAHAIVIVGYNDIDGYWIIKNSWGIGYRAHYDQGYFKLGYGECDIGNRGISYIDLSKNPSEDVKASDVQISVGSKSGILEDTYYKDGIYMTLSEDCFLLSCKGLNATFTFNKPASTNITSIDLIANHRAQSKKDFSFSYWDQNNNHWSSLDTVPDSKFYLMKYNLCNSKSECSKYISSGNIQTKYYHLSCSWCFGDSVNVDWLYLETTRDLYCSASTNNANMEYITKVSLNGNEKTSGSSTYSDFTDTVLSTLSKGNFYTLYVDGHTVGNYTEYVNAWIDFNNDKNFTDDEKIDLGSYTFNGTHTFSKTFIIPNDAAPTEIRMRIYLKYGNAPVPCENAQYGEVEDYKLSIINDTNPPSVWVSDYGVGYVQAGSPAIIKVIAYDPSGVSSVYAKIESPYGTVIDTVQLYDDGKHNDGYANDGVYGNSWTTTLDERDYYVDFTAADTFENTKTYGNLDRFTTIPFLPTSKILLVDDSMYTSYINYYKNALTSIGYKYNLWDFDLRGEISNDTINSFKLIIWSSPLWKVPNTNQQSSLIQFLNKGGTLFISGQDLGFYLNNTNFYQNYLHASFVQDNTNLYSLYGVSNDPITNNVSIGILGGDGANNQWWPDEIDVISPAESIFFYNNLSSVPKTSPPTLEELPSTVRESLNKTKEYGSSGILSSGTGALKVDTGTYKVVYFAFGFEAINDTNTRNLIMKKVADWLLKSSEITIHSPLNITYDKQKILVNVTLNQKVKYIFASLNGERFSKECSDCNSTTYTDYAREGYNELVIKAINYDDSSTNQSVNFSVDTKEPSIIETNPKNKEYVKGLVNFTVKYTEDYLKNITLYLNASPTTEHQLINCPSGRKQECSATLDLSPYDGQEFSYYFVIWDAIRNVSSKMYNVIVDSSIPVVTINSPLMQVYENREVPLSVSLSENITKLEKSEDGERFRSLCRNCDSYERSSSYDDGVHNITIKATDKGGNEGFGFIIFGVDNKEPYIRKISPKDEDYVKGIANFTVEYDEDIVMNVTLFYGKDGLFYNYTKYGCPWGSRQECTLTVNLTDFDNQTIQYYFVVNSFLHNDTSKIYSVIVDNTIPTVTINSPLNDTYNSRYVRLNISVSEEVELLRSVNGDSFTRLCSNCDIYDRTSYFRDGVYNVTFLATDEAGNEGRAFVWFNVGQPPSTTTTTSTTVTSTTSTTSSTTTTIPGPVTKCIEKDNVPLYGDLSATFPASGVIKNGNCAGLEDSIFYWRGNSYDFHEQVDLGGVAMRHSLALSNANGTEKMVVESGDIKYQLVFDSALSGTGSVSNPNYTYPINIKLLDKDFLIVGCDSNQVKVLTGSIGTATATTPVTYGDYFVYSDLGSDNSWARIIIKDKNGNIVDTMLINKGDNKQSAATGLTVMITAVRALQDGTIVGADLVVGSTSEGITKTYDNTADVTSTGTASDRFPGETEWGIQVGTNTISGTTSFGGTAGSIAAGDVIEVVYKPARTKYLGAGEKVFLPNGYGELGFEGWNTDTFATITIAPIGGTISAYNYSADTQAFGNLNGLVISSDISGSIVSIANTGYDKAYVLFNYSRSAGHDVAMIGFWDSTKSKILVNGTFDAEDATSTGEYRSKLINFTNASGAKTQLDYDFKLSYGNAGDATFHLNVTIGQQYVINKIFAGVSATNQSMKFGFQNRTAATTSQSPEFRLGSLAATSEWPEVNATTEGWVYNAGKMANEVVDDSGLLLQNPYANSNSDRVVFKVPFKDLHAKVYLAIRQ